MVQKTGDMAVGHFNIDRSVLDYSQAALHPQREMGNRGKGSQREISCGSCPRDMERLQDREVAGTLLPSCSKDDPETLCQDLDQSVVSLPCVWLTWKHADCQGSPVDLFCYIHADVLLFIYHFSPKLGFHCSLLMSSTVSPGIAVTKSILQFQTIIPFVPKDMQWSNLRIN